METSLIYKLSRRLLSVLWFGISSEHIQHQQFRLALELRVMMLICVVLMLISTTLYRLTDLTILQYQYINIGTKNGQPSQIQRGNILDGNGTLLASDLKIAALSLEPKHIIDPKQDLLALQKILPDLDFNKWYPRFAAKKGFYWIKRRISPRTQQHINQLGIPGLKFHYGYSRVYPMQHLTSHLLGYVDVDQKGLSGIEKAYDAQLAMGSENITLTLDISVQHLLHHHLTNAMTTYRAKGAAGVIMDVNNGNILAMVSLPDFDSNHVGNAISEKYFNRVTKGIYELGSVFKIFNTAMLLEAGQYDINSIFDASKNIRYGRHHIADYHGKYKPLSVKEIFIYSSNIGSAKMALTLGGEQQKQYLQQFGLISPLQISLPEIGKPQYPRQWRDINTMTISFGHGIAVSPLQLTAAAAAMVNGGIYHHPVFVRDFEQHDDSKRVISKPTSDYMRKLFYLNAEKGSGRAARVSGYFVGGKTGTAEKIGARSYHEDNLISNFIAAFPMHDPRYLIFVLLDEPQSEKGSTLRPTGGRVAAPIVKKIIPQLAALRNVTPIAPDKWNIVKERLMLPEHTTTRILGDSKTNVVNKASY